MPGRRLIYCRTPLQALIASEIQKLAPAEDTVLYYPISASPKHRFYFERMTAAQKLWVEFRSEEPPEVVHLLSAYRRVPSMVRRGGFDEYLYSSIGCLVLSLIMRNAPRRACLCSFDDGLFNVTRAVLLDWVYRESPTRRLIKAVLGGPRNAALFERAAVHYTIYDESSCLSPAPSVVRVHPFARRAPGAGRKRVQVIVGTPPQFLSATGRKLYASAVRSGGRHVFIPHPAEDAALLVRNLPDAARLAGELELLIAEDAVARLAALGYRPEVLGFGSTVLANLADDYPTTNVDLGSDLADSNRQLVALGVPAVPFAEAFPQLGQGVSGIVG